MSRKIEIAVEVLKEHQPFKIGRVGLLVNERGEVEVTGWSQFGILGNITKSLALKELEEAKSTYFNLLMDSEQLRELLAMRRTIFRLLYNKGEHVPILICREEDGVVRWEN